MSTTTGTIVENTTLTTATTCHKCGADLSHVHLDGGQDAHQRIQELENQVKILTLRATEAGIHAPTRGHTPECLGS